MHDLVQDNLLATLALVVRQDYRYAPCLLGQRQRLSPRVFGSRGLSRVALNPS